MNKIKSTHTTTTINKTPTTNQITTSTTPSSSPKNNNNPLNDDEQHDGDEDSELSVQNVIKYITLQKSATSPPSFLLSQFIDLQNSDGQHLLDAPPFLYKSLLDITLARPDLNSCESLILLPKTEIQRLTQLSFVEVNHLLAFISNTLLYRLYSNDTYVEGQMLPKSISLMTSKQLSIQPVSTLRLRCGSRIIDQFLGGGFVPIGITEISGEAGSGKTQLCMQLCFHVQLPYNLGGLNGGAIYIGTETPFPTNRFVKISQTRLDLINQMLDEEGLSRIDLPPDMVMTRRANDINGLLDMLTKNFQDLIRNHVTKLLIIDSIAALIRPEYGNENILEKTNKLWELSNQLRIISEQYGISIVVINQVTDYFESKVVGNAEMNDNDITSHPPPPPPHPQQPRQSTIKATSINNNSNSSIVNSTSATSTSLIIRPIKRRRKVSVPSYQNSKQQYSPFLLQNNNGFGNTNTFYGQNNKATIPALGLSWTNFVNTRIMLSKTSHYLSNNTTPVRKMSVILSSNLSNQSIYFYIDTQGVVGLSPNENDQTFDEINISPQELHITG